MCHTKAEFRSFERREDRALSCKKGDWRDKIAARGNFHVETYKGQHWSFNYIDSDS